MRPATRSWSKAIRLPISFRSSPAPSRSCSFTEQGRRQIFRFARAGDIFGLIDIDHWHYTAEAVDAVILRSISKQAFDNALDGSQALRRDLRMRVGDLTAERERHLTFLAFESAEQRLAWFLRNFSVGRADDGFLTLPMTRQEIGDYLGLSLETVSRAFGSLKRAGVIEMRGAEKYRLVRSSRKLRREALSSAGPFRIRNPSGKRRL